MKVPGDAGVIHRPECSGIRRCDRCRGGDRLRHLSSDRDRHHHQAGRCRPRLDPDAGSHPTPVEWPCHRSRGTRRSAASPMRCWSRWLYAVAYLAMDRLVASSTSHHTLASVDARFAVTGTCGTGVHRRLHAPGVCRDRWHNIVGCGRLYVHAMNGFYIDIPARRLTARFYGQTAPGPVAAVLNLISQIRSTQRQESAFDVRSLR